MDETVLLVDDDEDVLDVIESMLKDLGCQVIRASWSGSSRATGEQRSISILITDIHMPRMDGHELAERARDAVPL